MHTDDVNENGAEALNARTADLPVCKPVSIAFAPTQSGQAQLTGLVSIAAPPTGKPCCPVTLTSTNPQLLTVQPVVCVALGQTTAVVHAIVATQSAAMAHRSAHSSQPAVVYVLASVGDVAAPVIARVVIPDVHNILQGDRAGTPSVQSLNYTNLTQGIVTLNNPAPHGGTVVNVGSTNTNVFAPQQQVTVLAGHTTAEIPTLVTPTAQATSLIAFASVGDDAPRSVPVTVPAHP